MHPKITEEGPKLPRTQLITSSSDFHVLWMGPAALGTIFFDRHGSDKGYSSSEKDMNFKTARFSALQARERDKPQQATNHAVGPLL